MTVKTDKTMEKISPAVSELASAAKEKDKHSKLNKAEIWLSTGGKEEGYDSVFASYLFEKDELVDKAAREKYVKENKQS